MKIVAAVFLLLLHLVFLAGIGFAFLDFPYPHSVGFVGFVFFAVTFVLGFPWTLMVLRYFGETIDPAMCWLGVAVNYVILWSITFIALRRMFRGKVTDSNATRSATTR